MGCSALGAVPARPEGNAAGGGGGRAAALVGCTAEGERFRRLTREGLCTGRRVEVWGFPASAVETAVDSNASGSHHQLSPCKDGPSPSEAQSCRRSAFRERRPHHYTTTTVAPARLLAMPWWSRTWDVDPVVANAIGAVGGACAACLFAAPLCAPPPPPPSSSLLHTVPRSWSRGRCCTRLSASQLTGMAPPKVGAACAQARLPHRAPREEHAVVQRPAVPGARSPPAAARPYSTPTPTPPPTPPTALRHADAPPPPPREIN